MSYLLLDRFRRLFERVRYRHRDSSLGDSVAWYLPEDLYALHRSARLDALISTGERVLNIRNTLRGVRARRGDATFGEIVPHTEPILSPGFVVKRGDIATAEIGIEVKILAKTMIKQIDRVIGDLTRQVQQFQKAGGSPISTGIVGINFADRYTSYEGEKAWPTDGGKNRHPIQEAVDAERRLLSRAAPALTNF